MRNQSGPIPVEEPIQKSVSDIHATPFLPSADSMSTDDEPRFTSTDSDLNFGDNMKDFGRLAVSRNGDRKKREKSPIYSSSISSHWQGLLKYFSLKSLFQDKQYESEESDEEYEEESPDQPDVLLQSGLNMVLRVQPMRHTITERDSNSSLAVQQSSRSGSSSPRKRSMKSGSSSPRKGSRDSPSPSDRSLDFQINFVPQQSSTIFMDRSDIENQLSCSRRDIPCVFIAKLQKLLSPKDQEMAKRDKAATNGKNSPRKGDGNKADKDHAKIPGDLDSPQTPSVHDTESSAADSLSCIVRVVVIDRRRQFCNDLYSPVVGRILEEQPLLQGHVLVPDMLRRQLKLDICSRVWLQTLRYGLTTASSFTLYPLGNKPASFTNDKISLAFRNWLDQVSNEDYPLLVFQGLFVRFPLPGQYLECQITFSAADSIHKGSYTMLNPSVLRSSWLNVFNGSRVHELNNPVIQPMLAYTSIASIDPLPLEIDIENLG